jgi:hypothetical protein
MNKANVGDVVRSYDFKPMAGRGDCYIEGIVIEKHAGYYKPVNEKHAGHYKIAVQNRVWDGEVEPILVGEYVHTPFEVHFEEYEERIQKLMGCRSTDIEFGDNCEIGEGDMEDCMGME